MEKRATGAQDVRDSLHLPTHLLVGARQRRGCGLPEGEDDVAEIVDLA